MSRRFGALLVAGALAVVAVPAHAHHIPGATYTGAAATGGTVELQVAADGASVTRFEASAVPTDCGVVSVSASRRLPIADHAFSRPSTEGTAFSGSFGSGPTATGTLSQGGECSFSVAWSATTSAAPPPPPAADVTAPDFAARAGRRLRRGGAILVRVRRPSEACRVTARGSVSLRGRTYRLRRTSAQLAQGGSVRLGLILGRRGVTAARRALRNGRRVEARITVAAVDAAGNRTLRRLSRRLG